ncbi:MAG TPA: hypothetical protein VJ953_02435 [Saprospiraceae bacterium]|nr:hypothetical protein [Saprospiraceae bacterium]
MKTKEVIELIQAGGTVKDVVLSDLESQILGFRDALLLAENGYAVPIGNIKYDDTEVAYDSVHDETEWTEKYQNLQSFLHTKGLAAESAKDYHPEKIAVEITSDSLEMKDWLQKNTEKLEHLVNKLVRDLYSTEQLLKTKD